jgi:hypothetical protein
MGLCDGPLPRPVESYRVSTCIPFRLQIVGTRGQPKKEEYERTRSCQILFLYPSIPSF